MTAIVAEPIGNARLDLLPLRVEHAGEMAAGLSPTGHRQDGEIQRQLALT